MKFCISLLLSAASLTVAATIPAGTELQVRLTVEASSNKPSGSPVSAVLIAPVFLGGAQVIASGTTLSGNTADAVAAKAASDQSTEQPATLRIQFTKIQDRSGQSRPIYCVLDKIDNARETVDDSGLITGITASQTFEARIDQGINKLAERYQSFAQILSGVKGALLKQVDPSIDYQPGVEVEVKLTKALDWQPAPAISLVGEIKPADALSRLVEAEPLRTVAQSPPNPSDMTNLMFIGSKEQIQAAFEEAGWSSASELSRNAKIETAKAIIESRGYKEAPMSILYLDNRPPDLTFQKQNDTFEMRHHIRIWLRPQTFAGSQVWMAAATHDISFTLSPVSHNFTHGIDPKIDDERSKVTNDLLFTGKVHALALVDRTGLPQDPTNATGDHLKTDGKLAVLQF